MLALNGMNGVPPNVGDRLEVGLGRVRLVGAHVAHSEVLGGGGEQGPEVVGVVGCAIR